MMFPKQYLVKSINSFVCEAETFLYVFAVWRLHIPYFSGQSKWRIVLEVYIFFWSLCTETSSRLVRGFLFVPSLWSSEIKLNKTKLLLMVEQLYQTLRPILKKLWMTACSSEKSISPNRGLIHLVLCFFLFQIILFSWESMWLVLNWIICTPRFAF